MNNSPIAVGNRRLLKLAAFLETLPGEVFNFGEWCSNYSITSLGSPDKAHRCGTTACALGWATAIPSFRKLGLKLKRSSVIFPDGPGAAGTYLHGARAAVAVFHMSDDDAWDMFVVGRYGNTIPTIAAGIRRYVATAARGYGRV